jgi:hypothetical protein
MMDRDTYTITHSADEQGAVDKDRLSRELVRVVRCGLRLDLINGYDEILAAAFRRALDPLSITLPTESHLPEGAG